MLPDDLFSLVLLTRARNRLCGGFPTPPLILVQFYPQNLTRKPKSLTRKAMFRAPPSFPTATDAHGAQACLNESWTSVWSGQSIQGFSTASR